MPAEKLRLVTNRRPLSKAQKDLLVETCERLGFDSAQLLLDMAGAVPPHDLDAEAAILGSLFTSLDRSWLEEIIQSISPADFYSEANAKIFEAMVSLNEGGFQFDIITVTAWLRQSNLLAKCHGPSYLAGLMDGAPVVAKKVLAQHTGIIKKLSTRRKLGALCHEIAAESYSNEIAADSNWRPGVANRIKSLCESDDEDSYDGSISNGLRLAHAHAIETIQSNESSAWTDIRQLDEELGRNPTGQVILVKGLSGGGKSAFMGNFAVDVAAGYSREQYDPKDEIHRIIIQKLRDAGTISELDAPPSHLLVPRGVLIFSLEMKQWEIAERMACSQALIDNRKIKHNTMTARDWSYYQAASIFLENKPIFVDDRPDLTYERMKTRIKARERHFAKIGVRLSLVILDNAQLVKPAPNSRFPTWEQELSDYGMRIKSQILHDHSKLCFMWLSQIDEKTGHCVHCKQLFSHADCVLHLDVDWSLPKGRIETTSKARRAKIKIEKYRSSARDITIHTYFHAAYTRWHDADALTPESGQ